MLEVTNAWYRVSVKWIVYSPDWSWKIIASEKHWSKKRPRISNVCFEVTLESFDFKVSDECIEIWFFDIESIKILKYYQM